MSTPPEPNIAVLGAGAWGTTLAIVLARNHHSVVLWGHDAAHVATLARTRCNERYLADVPFPEAMRLTADLGEAVRDASDLVVVVPSGAFGALLGDVRRHLRAGTRVAWATKGLEPDSGRFLHQVVEQRLGPVDMGVISGPTFAREVARSLPTAVTVASPSPEYAGHLAAWLHNGRFRAYTSSDMVGVQLGGTTKNVLAIAAGIADGLGYGANTRAALVTRGLVEMTRLGLALGGQRDTFSGLAGLGDLVLTCTDDQSRNRRFGLLLGGGDSVGEAQAKIGQLVEGRPAARDVMHLARTTGTEMPICEQVFRVLFENRAPLQAVDELFHRERKAEGL